MVTMFYERLPAFCYKCGVIEHGKGNCPLIDSGAVEGVACNVLLVFNHIQEPQDMQLDKNEGKIGPEPPTVEGSDRMQGKDGDQNDDNQFSSWLVVQHRRGHGRGRGLASGQGSMTELVRMTRDNLQS